MKCKICNKRQSPPGSDVCEICAVEDFLDHPEKHIEEPEMPERRSELRVVWVAIAIVACQVLGIDVPTLSALLRSEGADILDTIKQVHSGDGGAYAAALAGVYALGRSYLKGRVK